MTLSSFDAHDSTGSEATDLFFKSETAGPAGAHYYLFQEKHHSRENVDDAKAYLRNNFDVVTITVIRET